MLSFKHLFRIFSSFDKARANRFVPDRRFIGVFSNRDIRVQNSTACYRLYSSKQNDRVPYPPKGPKVHPSEECHTPNLMSKMPQPKKPFQEEYDKLKKKNMKVFYLGVVVFIISIIGVYANFTTERKAKLKPPQHLKQKGKRIIPRNPESSEDIPKKIPYLLIGGGTASFSAFRAIKSSDPTALVLMVTNEPYLPYMRPPLSKEMWFNADQKKVEKLIFKQWNGTERSLLYEPEEFYTPIHELLQTENGGISIASGYKVVEIDPYCHKVKLDDDTEIEYDKALIATGAQVKSLPVFDTAMSNPNIKKRVKVLRNIYDFEDLQESFKTSLRVAVIGGGFLGSELACALARISDDNKIVYQVFKEGGNLEKVLPEYLSRWTTEKVMKEGVKITPNAEVVTCNYDRKDKMLHLVLSNGETLVVDQVVLCVGVRPDTSLSVKSGLEVDPVLGGFLVNSELQARTDLYIAGDASCFYDPKFGRRRIEHHDHAVVTGRLAGENMTGAHKPYIHQSMFWSDLGPNIGFEAIGLVDSKLPTVGVFAKAKASDTPRACITETDSDAVRTRIEGAKQAPPSCVGSIDDEERKEIEVSSKTLREDMPSTENPDDYGKGVIFYLQKEKIVGIVLWNVFNRIQIARQVLKEDKTYDDLNEVAKLFNIHQD